MATTTATGGYDAVRLSSSPELSSPPGSLSDPDSPSAQQLLNESLPAQNSEKRAASPVPLRKKPGRKPGSTNKAKPTTDGTSTTNTAAVKVKKPRKPKDPNAPPVVRKKKVTDVKSDTKPSSGTSRQSKLTEMTLSNEPTFSVAPQAATFASQNGKNEDIAKPINSFFGNSAPTPPAPTEPVRTSGQNYDPIRSNYDPVRETVVSQSSFSTPQMSPKPLNFNRASASPSISSLVDPPNQPSTSPSLASQSFFSKAHQMMKQNQDGPTTVPASPNMNRLASSPMVTVTSQNDQSNQDTMMSNTEQQPSSWERASAPPIVQEPSPVIATVQPVKKSSPVVPASILLSSAAPSPKSSKVVDITPPPLPGSGNGLMLNGPDDGTESRAPTIILHIPMNGEHNKYVNFTRLAEERYGWDALHPRLAAQRERLARVAAAGAALERSGSNKESGDEMSLDLSEGEGSNAEMGAMSDGRTGTDGGAKKPVRKRKTKEDEYDKDDGFVDDTELLWEEQAAASKDGFFVYSGPLVPEGEKPVLERAEGSSKRGRGSGRVRGAASGRGSTSGRGGATNTGGPGSRGGAVTRKPRITKADRARMLEEKAARELLGGVAKPPANYNNMVQIDHATNLGGTPLVFN